MKSVRRASYLALALAPLLTSRLARSEAGPGGAESSAAADGVLQPSAVRLEVTPANSSVEPLLRAELSQLGLDVTEDSSEAAPITIRVVFTSEALEVSIVDGATGDVTGRELFSVTEGRRMDARTAALHAAEFLRWHLRSHAPGQTEPRPARTAPAEPAEPAEPAARTPAPADLRIGLVPMATFSPGGTEAGFGGQVDLLRRWGSFGVRLLGATSLLNNRMSVPEGSIDVHASWGGVEAVAILGAPTGGFSVDLGMGIGLFGAALRGTANPDNISKEDHVLTAAPLFDVRARQRLAAGFALTLGSSCLVPLRSNRMRVLEREVGRYGQAVVTLGLGVEFTLL